LRIINFAHGAQYMLGAFVGYLLLSWLGIGYWPALVLAPIIVGLGGAIVERVALSRLYNLDPLYGLLFTFGLALVIEGTFRYYYGAAGQPYAVPPSLAGGHNLGFMFLPNYRAWVVVASLICAPPPKTRLWSKPSASMCRCFSPSPMRWVRVLQALPASWRPRSIRSAR
jgi:branched-chain amino acid transport system permease protein